MARKKKVLKVRLPHTDAELDKMVEDIKKETDPKKAQQKFLDTLADLLK